MIQFYYALLNILNTKTNSLIKIASFTLGLVVALVLFSKVAFEVGYDTFYPDADRIYQLQRKISSDGKKTEQNPRLYAPVIRDLKSKLPEIEAGTTIIPPNDEYLYYKDRIFKEQILRADEGFFDLFHIQLLQGDPSLLGVESHIFISQSTAKRFFENESPVGQKINSNRTSMTVAGVFEDVTNSHLIYSAIMPIGFGDLGWHNPDPFSGYIKLSPEVTTEQLENRIKEVLPLFIDVKAEESRGNYHEYFLYPVTQLHSGRADVKRMAIILSMLAFSLLFVAAMNYVLISISSMAERAKKVGVHKCNGASNKDIFRLFFYETVTILLIALLFALILIFAFRGQIENIIQTPLSDLFSFHNLWVIGVVVISLLLLAGIMPALIFSAIPVTTLFRTYAVSKKQWKRVLLFVQFTGAAFMITLLVIIVRQYDLLLHVNQGYDTENLYYSENISGVPRTQIARLKSELERLPGVTSVSIASSLPINFLEGIGATDMEDDRKAIHCVAMGADSDYLSTMGITLIKGENVGDNSHNYTRAVVNESFVRQIGWSDSPIGKSFISGINGKDSPVQVIGLIENFKISNLNNKEFDDLYPPIAIFSLDAGEENWLFSWDRIMIRLHKKEEVLLKQINKLMQDLLDKPSAFFIDYNFLIAEKYRDALLYRNSIWGASFILLLITALGLLGFTKDEINRRSKEIAIRKITGATVGDVLNLVINGVLIISLPALLMGFVLSYLVGIEWLQQFAVKIPLNIFLFLFSALLFLSGIIVCVSIRTWHTANENPVRNLRTE